MTYNSYTCIIRSNKLLLSTFLLQVLWVKISTLIKSISGSKFRQSRQPTFGSIEQIENLGDFLPFCISNFLIAVLKFYHVRANTFKEINFSKYLIFVSFSQDLLIVSVKRNLHLAKFGNKTFTSKCFRLEVHKARVFQARPRPFF